MNRRDALRLLAAGLAAAPAVALASWDDGRVGVCHLDLGIPLTRPRGMADLLGEVGQLTSVPTRPDLLVRAPDHPDLWSEPLLALVGDAAFDLPSEPALDTLRRHLGRGGLLFVDDSSGQEDSPFHDSVRQLAAALFPESPLLPLDFGHAVYRSFFLVDGVSGRFAVRPYLEGVQLGDITPLVVSRNDLCGAWTRSDDGGWAWEVVGGGTRQRTRAFELGVNLVMYGLTANYKLDAVHVEALLRRLRDEGRIP